MNQIKTCIKCNQEKPVSEFHKCKANKDGLKNICKSCRNLNYIKKKKVISVIRKNHYDKNKEKIILKSKKYYENNKEKLIEYNREYRKKNKDRLKEKGNNYRQKNKQSKTNYDKQYAKRKALYKSFDLEYLNLCGEQTRQNDKYLEVKCTYCGKWFIPSNIKIKNRIQILKGKNRGESRLYCSNECKSECPIYGQEKYPKGYKPATSREVQPELRQMVFKRDNYTCVKCGSIESIQCHHIEGINYAPLESADIDGCITVCKKCHKEIHKKKDCNYQDMKCNDPYTEFYNFIDKFDYDIRLIKFDEFSELNNPNKYELKNMIKTNPNIILIFENEWLYKRNIVKRRLNHMFKNNNGSIFARKCEIRETPLNDGRQFINEYHIQGFVGSSIKLGAYYNNKLIAVMTFNKTNISRGYKEKIWEISRFCIGNTPVVGIASKLFKHFIVNYNPKEIISYADRRWSQGKLYNKLGMDLIKETKPNYWYFKKGSKKLQHRFKYRRNVLNGVGSEWNIMKQKGYDRIWDCGSLKFLYK